MAKYKVKSVLTTTSTITMFVEADSEIQAEGIAASQIDKEKWQTETILKTKVKLTKETS